jgi:hypothetical protein
MEVRAIDHEAVALMECCACGCQGGLECRPWHDRRGVYRIVATCLACGAGEEV